MQSKRRKQISPVLRSCVGPAVWMVQSWGKQRRQKRKTEEVGREPEGKMREKIARGPDLLPFTVALL